MTQSIRDEVVVVWTGEYVLLAQGDASDDRPLHQLRLLGSIGAHPSSDDWVAINLERAFLFGARPSFLGTIAMREIGA